MNFDLTQINWLSVVVVTIISFPLGSLWHSKLLFGKPWKEDVHFDPGKKINFAGLFGLSAIMHFIAVAGLDLIIGPGSSWLEGLHTGFIVSILWAFTSMTVTHLFAGRTTRLILIDGGFYLVFFSLAGLILGAW